VTTAYVASPAEAGAAAGAVVADPDGLAGLVQAATASTQASTNGFGRNMGVSLHRLKSPM
jgi:hypothetical protein